MFKKFISSCVAAIFVATAIFPIFSASAQTGGAVKFQITAPSTAIVGEAFDVTVTALDKDGKKATGYLSSILFQTDYVGDTYPMPGRPIVFTADDGGEKKFSKWVIFKKAGKQKLRVMDTTQDITGEITVTVEEWTPTASTSTGEIQILTPVNDGKITTPNILVSGIARKNSKIAIELNGQKVGNVVSDADGLFTYEVQNITQESNIIKASLLDASDAVITTSPEVKFSKATETNSIYGVVIQPGTTVESGTGITLNIDAVKGLASVTAMLDGSLLTAKEISDGKYQITTTAPQKEWEYPIDVTAKTLTNQETKKEKIATLTVTKKEEKKPEVAAPSFKNVKTETDKQKVTFTFSVENAPENLDVFEISYASGSVTTYSGSKILKNGEYSWYINDLAPGSYTFYIQGKDTAGANIEGLKSEALMATIGVEACTVSNVGEISIKTDSSKSVLTWAPVDGATKYNVYKIDASGKYNLVSTVDTPSYTLYLSQGAITYDNFAVKAVCGDNTESTDYSQASRVQTWPGILALVLIISALAGFAIIHRRGRI